MSNTIILNDEHQTERTSALRSDDSGLTFKSAKGERRRKRKHVAVEVGLGPEGLLEDSYHYHRSLTGCDFSHGARRLRQS